METKDFGVWQNFKAHFLQEKKQAQLHKHWLESIQISKIKSEKTNLKLFLQSPSELHKKWAQENLLKDFQTYVEFFLKNLVKFYLKLVLACLFLNR